MLVDLASAVATGREAGVIAQGRTEEELEKRLGALLLAGEQVIAIDNCEAPLGGEFLCAMLTQRVVRPRILGSSEAPELPSNAFVTANGNNLALAGDLTRRAVLCRLDPKHERPELRMFATDPIEAVKADRGRYVAAALIVLRAYQVAGRPDQPTHSAPSRSGAAGCAARCSGSAKPIRSEPWTRRASCDPKLDALTAVSDAVARRDRCRRRLGARRRRARHAAARTTAGRGADAQQPEYGHPDLRQALLGVAGKGGVDPQRLGQWLAANKDRVVQGLRIVRQGLSRGVMKWRLEGSEVGAGDAGG